MGKTGAWFAYKLSFEGLDTEEDLVHIVCMKDGNITEKLAQEKRRLFEEKEKEAKRLEKKLKLKVQRTFVARAVWEMA